jgi:hypothetical protein
VKGHPDPDRRRTTLADSTERLRGFLAGSQPLPSFECSTRALEEVFDMLLFNHGARAFGDFWRRFASGTLVPR